MWYIQYFMYLHNDELYTKTDLCINIEIKTIQFFFKIRYYTERKICLNLFGLRKFVLVLQPKLIFLCNKEKYIWFKSLLLYFKDPHLKSKGPVL